MAERGGFEPPVPFGHTRFPSVLLKPLGHLSGGGREYDSRDLRIEAYQGFVAGRYPSGVDVAIDALGALVAIAAVGLYRSHGVKRA